MKTHLTDIAIKRLALTPVGQVTHWDETTPGFGLRCSAKRKSFVVMYGAKRRLKTLGRYPDLSLADARTQAKRFLANHDPDANTSARQAVTFAAARDRFLQDCAGRNKPRTVADYRRLLHRHFNFKTALGEVDRQQVMRVISQLGATPSEQSHAFVAIRTMMNWCVRHGLIEHSVVPPLPQTATARDRVLSEGEVCAVLKVAQKTSFPFGPIVQLLLLTGQRRTEVGHLRRSWLEGEAMVLPEGFAKNKRAHRLPLGPMAQRLLADLPDTGDLLFPAATNPDKPFSTWAWHKRRFDQQLPSVKPYQLHDLRRTFATLHAQIGTPIHVTEKLLNHVSGSLGGVAAVYNRHAYFAEMQTAMQGYEAYLSQLIET